MYVYILYILGIALLFKFLFVLLSMLEKQLICKSSKRFELVESRSLGVFKNVRDLLCLAAAVESIYFNGWPPALPAMIIGTFLAISGMFLRAYAILTLGQYWSFHIVKFEGHKQIQNGVYKHIRHPAYIGNIYIIGIFLCAGAKSIALLTLILVIAFYLYRSRIEDRVLRCLSD